MCFYRDRTGWHLNGRSSLISVTHHDFESGSEWPLSCVLFMSFCDNWCLYLSSLKIFPLFLNKRLWHIHKEKENIKVYQINSLSCVLKDCKRQNINKDNLIFNNYFLSFLCFDEKRHLNPFLFPLLQCMVYS